MNGVVDQVTKARMSVPPPGGAIPELRSYLIPQAEVSLGTPGA